MLKKISVLIVLASMAMTSCQTLEFSDVVPETAGSPLGGVKLGKENVDFFVVPGKPVTPAEIRGEVPVPPQNIVVFRTREQTVPYKALKAAGAPIRGARNVFTEVFDKVTSVAFGWLKWGKKDKKSPEQQQAPAAAPQGGGATMPMVYPAGMLPQDSFANARANGASTGRKAARDLHPAQTNRNGG